MITYGCQMNVYDSKLIAKFLIKNGFSSVDTPEDAEIIFINTCSVREHAEMRAFGRITSLKKLKADNPNLKIFVVGCTAQRMEEKIWTKFPFVNFIVGPDNYRKIPQLLSSPTIRGIFTTENNFEKYTGCTTSSDRKVTSFIAVTRGCNNFCSYCIVPYLRGRERSRDPQDIMKEISFKALEGVKEIILLGQNVNSYNYGVVNFSGLLKMVQTVPQIKRVRFTTSHPKDVTDELLDIISFSDKICNHLHLPLQSGSNRILSLMNRQYTREYYIKLVEKIREKLQSVAITTDILVGFPTEEEEDFQATLGIIKRIRFDFAYMFRYSKREGTRAVEFGDIPEEVKVKRLKEVIALQNKITKDKNSELLGKSVQVLVEAKSRRPDEFYGKTKENKAVVLSGDVQIGDIAYVKVSEIRGWTPYGKVVHE